MICPNPIIGLFWHKKWLNSLHRHVHDWFFPDLMINRSTRPCTLYNVCTRIQGSQALSTHGKKLLCEELDVFPSTFLVKSRRLSKE